MILLISVFKFEKKMLLRFFFAILSIGLAFELPLGDRTN